MLEKVSVKAEKFLNTQPDRNVSSIEAYIKQGKLLRSDLKAVVNSAQAKLGTADYLGATSMLEEIAMKLPVAEMVLEAVRNERPVEDPTEFDDFGEMDVEASVNELAHYSALATIGLSPMERLQRGNSEFDSKIASQLPENLAKFPRDKFNEKLAYLVRLADNKLVEAIEKEFPTNEWIGKDSETPPDRMTSVFEDESDHPPVSEDSDGVFEDALEKERKFRGIQKAQDQYKTSSISKKGDYDRGYDDGAYAENPPANRNDFDSDQEYQEYLKGFRDGIDQTIGEEEDLVDEGSPDDDLRHYQEIRNTLGSKTSGELPPWLKKDDDDKKDDEDDDKDSKSEKKDKDDDDSESDKKDKDDVKSDKDDDKEDKDDDDKDDKDDKKDNLPPWLKKKDKESKKAASEGVGAKGEPSTGGDGATLNQDAPKTEDAFETEVEKEQNKSQKAPRGPNRRTNSDVPSYSTPSQALTAAMKLAAHYDNMTAEQALDIVTTVLAYEGQPESHELDEAFDAETDVVPEEDPQDNGLEGLFEGSDL